MKSFAAVALLVITILLGTASASSNQGQEANISDIPPYTGWVGPTSPLYGLKIWWEDLDERLAFNESTRTQKVIAHARERIAEAKAELLKKRSDAANKSIGLYRKKMEDLNITRMSVNDTGLQNALMMIEEHQKILENLLEKYPDNPGLQRAYNNSIKLEERIREHLEKINTAETEDALASGTEGNETDRKTVWKYVRVTRNATNTTIEKREWRSPD